MEGFIQSQKLSTRVAMNQIKKRTKSTWEEVHAEMKAVTALKEEGGGREKHEEKSNENFFKGKRGSCLRGTLRSFFCLVVLATRESSVVSWYFSWVFHFV